jgi:hypothetical protein
MKEEVKGTTRRKEKQTKKWYKEERNRGGITKNRGDKRIESKSRGHKSK